MNVIVIGGGIAGVATAYWLQTSGHRVCLIDRHATVAQEATFGHGGLLFPTPLDAGLHHGSLLDVPNMRQGWFSGYRSKLFRSGLSIEEQQRIQQRNELRLEHFATQYMRIKPLVDVSRTALAEIEARHALEYEQRTGVLHLFHSPPDLKCGRLALSLLAQQQYPHRFLNMDECLALEPSLCSEPFAGGALLQNERSANCPLFTKQLKRILDETGARLLLGREVVHLCIDDSQVFVEFAQRDYATGQSSVKTPATETISADAIVIAAGADSPALLAYAGLKLPLHTVRCHAMTAPIANQETAPQMTVVDPMQQITMTRLNNHIRVAGAAIPQPLPKGAPKPNKVRQHLLEKIEQATQNWLPGSLKLSARRNWDNRRLLSEDGLPIVGASSNPRLFVNMAHGPSGWGLACGTAKVVADMISGHTPELDEATLAALSPARFEPSVDNE